MTDQASCNFAKLLNLCFDGFTPSVADAIACEKTISSRSSPLATLRQEGNDPGQMTLGDEELGETIEKRPTLGP